jgi:hypothetical protein
LPLIFPASVSFPIYDLFKHIHLLPEAQQLARRVLLFPIEDRNLVSSQDVQRLRLPKFQLPAVKTSSPERARLEGLATRDMANMAIEAEAAVS